MNKHNTQSILKFFLLTVAVLSTGCGQSTLAASTETIENAVTPQPPSSPTLTVTPLPCYSWTQTSTTDIEKIAEEWFLSDNPQVPERNQYKIVDSEETWATICGNYQYLILKNEPLVHNPIEISLRMITQSAGPDYFYIDNIVVVAVNSDELLAKTKPTTYPRNRNIMTVIVTRPSIDALFESRIDYVFENSVWQIRWWGTRWKCINSEDSKWNNTVYIDCS